MLKDKSKDHAHAVKRAIHNGEQRTGKVNAVVRGVQNNSSKSMGGIPRSIVKIEEVEEPGKFKKNVIKPAVKLKLKTKKNKNGNKNKIRAHQVDFE